MMASGVYWASATVLQWVDENGHSASGLASDPTIAAEFVAYQQSNGPVAAYVAPSPPAYQPTVADLQNALINAKVLATPITAPVAANALQAQALP